MSHCTAKTNTNTKELPLEKFCWFKKKKSAVCIFASLTAFLYAFLLFRTKIVFCLGQNCECIIQLICLSSQGSEVLLKFSEMQAQFTA